MGQEDNSVVTAWTTRSGTELDSALEELKELIGNRTDPQANVIEVFSAG